MPASTALIAFDRADIAPALDQPKPERLVSGNPLRTTFSHYARGEVDCGLWHCEPGAWRIDFSDAPGTTREEFFHVLEGRIRITAESGAARTFGPGDACLIPAGFRGIFEVLEPVKKVYVMIDKT
jgi:uncharacterized cupin superfamily protein